MRLIVVVLFTVLLAHTNAYSEEIVTHLNMVRVLPVEGPPNIQPSGLTIRNNILFTVSDKHDDTIFRVQLSEEKAVLLPEITFKLSKPVAEEYLDLEGITHDREGNFYLVSESAFRILKVSSDGKSASWITPSLRSYGEDVGLFTDKSAYFEGITMVGHGKFVVSAERRPRGLIEVDLTFEPLRAFAYKKDETKLQLPKYRQPDFSALFWENGTLYALSKNSYAICKLIKTEDGFEEKDFWSYEAVVTREEYRYRFMLFGQAEGFCMDDKYVYVILDNNGNPKQNDPNDRRPLLLILERPMATQG